MRRESLRFLSVRNVLAVHADTIAREGGTPGVRDEALLAWAVDMPQATFGGELLHVDLAGIWAAYRFHICQNHPFADGNKRTGAFCLVLFLSLNGVADEYLPDEAELERVTFRVADLLRERIPQVCQLGRVNGRFADGQAPVLFCGGNPGLFSACSAVGGCRANGEWKWRIGFCLWI